MAFPIRAPLCLREATFQLLRRPGRSLLVLQTIIWGSAAAIFPQAIYQGSRQTVLTRAGELAADRMIIASPAGPVLPSWDAVEPFGREHPLVEVASGVSVRGQGGFDLVGTDGAHLSARRHLLAAGRSFSREELAAGAPVCILEADAAERLFPGRTAIGADLRLSDGRAVRVIGVVKPLPPSLVTPDELGYDTSHPLHFLARAIIAELGVVPPGLTWLSHQAGALVPGRFLGEPPRWILLRAPPESIAALCEEIKQSFAARGVEVLVYSNMIVAALMAPELKNLLAISRDIFAICLAMGIIVVANVMLLSVNERKLEIAVRRCEGATTADIVAQFLLETGIFCSAGAAIGVPLGIALAWLRSSLEPAALVSWALPWHHVAVTVVAVFAGGMIAGLAPAYRAARMDPVEVLSRA